MLGSLAVVGATRHDRAFCSKQLQTASSGVGGKVVLASKEPLMAGQSVLVKVCADWAGEFGPVVPLYSAERRVKSSDTSTLLVSSTSMKGEQDTYLFPSAEKVTIP